MEHYSPPLALLTFASASSITLTYPKDPYWRLVRDMNSRPLALSIRVITRTALSYA